MARKQLTEAQQHAFDFVRTAGWLTEDDAVVCAFLKYVARERERTGLGLKEVGEETYRQQEKGYFPQRPGKKGYKPVRKPLTCAQKAAHKKTLKAIDEHFACLEAIERPTPRKTPEKVQKS